MACNQSNETDEKEMDDKKSVPKLQSAQIKPQVEHINNLLSDIFISSSYADDDKPTALPTVTHKKQKKVFQPSKTTKDDYSQYKFPDPPPYKFDNGAKLKLTKTEKSTAAKVLANYEKMYVECEKSLNSVEDLRSNEILNKSFVLQKKKILAELYKCEQERKLAKSAVNAQQKEELKPEVTLQPDAESNAESKVDEKKKKRVKKVYSENTLKQLRKYCCFCKLKFNVFPELVNHVAKFHLKRY